MTFLKRTGVLCCSHVRQSFSQQVARKCYSRGYWRQRVPFLYRQNRIELNTLPVADNRKPLFRCLIELQQADLHLSGQKKKASPASETDEQRKASVETVPARTVDGRSGRYVRTDVQHACTVCSQSKVAVLQ